MGFLTTILISNDALHSFEQHPKEFAEAIFDGINRAQYERKVVFCPCQSYVNYIKVHPSRHADDHTFYLHYGNTLFNMDSYGKDFIELCRGQPEIAAEFLKRAKSLLKESERVYKELINKK